MFSSCGYFRLRLAGLQGGLCDVFGFTCDAFSKWEMENAWWRAFGICENICILKHKRKIRDSFVKEREVWGNIAENSDLRKEFF